MSASISTQQKIKKKKKQASCVLKMVIIGAMPSRPHERIDYEVKTGGGPWSGDVRRVETFNEGDKCRRRPDDKHLICTFLQSDIQTPSCVYSPKSVEIVKTGLC